MLQFEFFDVDELLKKRERKAAEKNIKSALKTKTSLPESNRVSD